MSGDGGEVVNGVDAPTSRRVEDPMSADRRTLVIGAVAMVALILVGAVSSALFATSPCAAIDPQPVEAGSAGTDVASTLDETFPGLDEAARTATEEAVTTMAGDLGAVTGVADVTGATDLAATDAGIAATGPTTTLLDGTGSDALASVDVDEGRVVGGGDALFGLLVENELTGQVDALQPLAVGETTAAEDLLAGQTCQDTATVGTPLAFHLDAGDGQLLVLRIDEDGGDPDLELRDPEQGRVWATRLALGPGSAGLLGERLTAGLGADVVVTGFRTDPDEEPAPTEGFDEIVEAQVVTALSRSTGEPRWQLDRDALSEVVDDQVPQAVEVRAVGEELAVVALRAVEGDEPTGAGAIGERLIGLDVEDGDVRWSLSLGADETLRDVLLEGPRTWLAVHDAGEGVEVAVVDTDGRRPRAQTDGERARLAAHRGGVVAAADGSVLHVAREGTEASSSPLRGLDALAHDDRLTVLFGDPDGGPGALAVTFAG
jgi:outer membrane protein assembly factor BamB